MIIINDNDKKLNICLQYEWRIILRTLRNVFQNWSQEWKNVYDKGFKKIKYQQGPV